MKLFSEAEAPLLRALGKLNYTNPFAPERLELEEIILGRPPAPRAADRHAKRVEKIMSLDKLKS